MKSFVQTEEARLFQDCLDLSPRERIDFLDTLQSENPVCCERLRSLLNAHTQSGDFLESFPGISRRIDESLEETPGTQIGRYELVELIGEGSWGSVWKARQTRDIKRHVALKILKAGMDTKEFLARFEAERQMLAMMDHPGIAQVYDAGATVKGRPYFVMELIQGHPLLEFADQQLLSMEERVRLFIKVCQATQHAHEKGFIHRDLKPSNILVAIHNGRPQPKIIDFGIAKASQHQVSDNTIFTQFNTFLGTPAYSSPEQLGFIGNEVDHRSDIYSLGALLYELLCGHKPYGSFKPGSINLEAIRNTLQDKDPSSVAVQFQKLEKDQQLLIAEKRASSPSRILSFMRGDLDHIVMKCLEKDPDQRYGSVAVLIEDLQNFLENKPVSAIAPSLSYRFQKLIRRNKQTFMAYTAACTILVAVLAILSAVRSGDSISPDFDNHGKSIAVLPFHNRSNLEEDQYFTDGIHDDLLTHISKIKDIRTISRTSVMAYKDTTKNLKTIGEELGVATILEGGVQRAGNMIRINAQLIDATTDAHLWAESYDKELTAANILRIQSEIALAIADALKAVLSPEEQQDLQVLPTQNLAALEAYFKGLALTRAMDNKKSREFLQEAILLDLGFADAYALLGYRIIEQASSMHYPIEDLIPKAEPLFKKALELDPRNGRAYVGIGRMHMANGDIEAAEKDLQRAIDLSPSDSEPYIYYSFLLHYHLRKPDLALKIISRGLKVDPQREDLRTSYIYVLTKLKRFEEASSAYEQFNKDFPDASSSHVLSDFFKEQGKYDQALRVMRAVYYEDPANFGHAKRVRILYSLLGDVESATFWRTRSKELNSAVDVSLDDNEQAPMDRYKNLFPQIFEDGYKIGEDVHPWKLREIVLSLRAVGQLEKADNLLQQLIRYTEKGHDMGLLVRLYSLAGDVKSAIEIIKEDPMRYASAYDQPDHENLRGHPEFEALMKEPLLELERQRRRVAEWEANGELAPIPPLPVK